LSEGYLCNAGEVKCMDWLMKLEIRKDKDGLYLEPIDFLEAKPRRRK